LYWDDASHEDVERAEAANEAAKQFGRPKGISDTALLKPLKEVFQSGRGLTQAEWLEALEEVQVCVSQSTLSRRVRELKRTGRVRNEKEIWWFVDPKIRSSERISGEENQNSK
jgi:arginine repressor